MTDVAWTTEADVFSASQTATFDGYTLCVETVITSSDETEVGWFLRRDDEEIDSGYLLPSQSGGVRKAFDEGRRLCVEALRKTRG